LAQAKSCLLAAQSRRRAYANTKRRDVSLSVGEEDLLSTRSLNLKVVAANARKLLPKFIGPFTVVKRVNAVAYKLGLPETMKVHDVFQVSIGALYKQWFIPPPAPTLFEDEHLKNTVEMILDHEDTPFRGRSIARRHYIVQWQGYGPEHNTFEPEENCANCTEFSDNWQYRSRTHKIANKSGQAPVGPILNKGQRKRKKACHILCRTVIATQFLDIQGVFCADALLQRILVQQDLLQVHD
jgi:hypothetical protein